MTNSDGVLETSPRSPPSPLIACAEAGIKPLPRPHTSGVSSAQACANLIEPPISNRLVQENNILKYKENIRKNTMAIRYGATHGQRGGRK